MSPIRAALITLVVLASGGALVSADSGPASLPGPPVNLRQSMSNQGLPAGAWINRTTVTLGFDVRVTGTPLTPQIELEAGGALTGEPTEEGTPVSGAPGTRQSVSFTVKGLAAGRYQWQARVVDTQGAVSQWVRFVPASTGAAFSIDRTPPSRPGISSSTNPRSGWWYNTRVERFSWDARDSDSGIAGYSYRVDHLAIGVPGALAARQSVRLANLKDGKWVLHVWAKDRAGNWSAGAVHRFNLDTAPPNIRFLGSTNSVFNPYATSQVWRYSIDQRAHVVLDIRRSGLRGPVLVRDLGVLKAGQYSFAWDGKAGDGRLTAADWHWLHVTATDGAGNSSNRAFGGISVQPVQFPPKRIVISLSQQTITAYEGGRLVYSSLATTGNYWMSPTPAGQYRIFAKYSPFQFVSPWPPGSPLWYAPAWSTYAMEFIGGGYFIHDAPWRSVFGPASQQGGQPGTDYGGTHGCVNVPYPTAAFLWSWAPMGTPVDVIG